MHDFIAAAASRVGFVRRRSALSSAQRPTHTDPYILVRRSFVSNERIHIPRWFPDRAPSLSLSRFSGLPLAISSATHDTTDTFRITDRDQLQRASVKKNESTPGAFLNQDPNPNEHVRCECETMRVSGRDNISFKRSDRISRTDHG